MVVVKSPPFAPAPLTITDLPTAAGVNSPDTSVNLALPAKIAPVAPATASATGRTG